MRHTLFILLALGSPLAAASAWQTYMPEAFKNPHPVDLARNPLMPAVTESTRPVLLLQRAKDEFGPKLQTLLAGKIRSVIRGAAPMVLLEGRIFRPGDEIVRPGKAGAPAEPLLANHKLQLKAVEPDRLIFIVWTLGDKPQRHETYYALEEKLRARR